MKFNMGLENVNESLPTLEEVRNIIEAVAGTENLLQRRMGEDDEGMYLLELEIKTADGSIEYSYIRKGDHAIGGSASNTAIHMNYFDLDGMPEAGGRSIAEYIDGEWVMHK